MRVIPVIDILNAVVVHAVRGKRKEYQPLQGKLCNSVDPVEVAKAFRDLGFSELYVADLDAITGCKSNFQLLKRIIDETGLKLMVDAGVTDIQTAQKLLENKVSKVIIGTETLQSKNFLQEAVKTLGSDKVVVSLDLKNGEVLVKSGFNGCTDPMCLLQEFIGMGVLQVIVLDLARVGSGEGVNVAFLKRVVEDLRVDVYVGGGVRGLQDLVELRGLGVSGVLVATALHQGKITIEELKQAGLV